MSTKTNETVTYQIEREIGRNNNETIRITIPKSWKVTFGPMIPGGHNVNDPCLRVYESKDQQRMVITSVKSFMDTSVTVQKLVRSTVTEMSSEQTKNFSAQASATEVDERWETVFEV